MKRKLPEDDELSKYLDNALQGAQRGSAFTQRMLAFARRQELKPQALDIPKLVSGMTNLLQSSLGPSVQIDAHFPMHLPKASVDPNQLELAILNLAMNARDAMPKGGTITIAAKEVTMAEEPALKAGDYVCISVMDTTQGREQKSTSRFQGQEQRKTRSSRQNEPATVQIESLRS